MSIFGNRTVLVPVKDGRGIMDLEEKAKDGKKDGTWYDLSIFGNRTDLVTVKDGRDIMYLEGKAKDCKDGMT